MSFRPIQGPRPRRPREVPPERGACDEAARHAARWRALVAAAPGPVILFAESGRILEWNPAARIALGWTREQARELTVADVLLTGERDERVRLEDVRRCDGTVVRAEVTIVADPGGAGGGGRMLLLRLPPG